MSEIDKAVELAWQIPGLFRKDEAAFLYHLARRKGHLVEIGCWMGRSTAILVQAAKVWGAHLTTIDAFTPMPRGHEQASVEQWKANLERIGLIPPELIAMRSDDAINVYHKDRRIALLFIDGLHTYTAVKSDLENWTARVDVGSVVALHDLYQPSCPGVCKAVNEWWETELVAGRTWHPLGQRDYTLAFKRTA